MGHAGGLGAAAAQAMLADFVLHATLIEVLG
jgi:hypothetical protein